ncbi:MFS transporter [uncultured Hydrogenophaga sp.]|jgi:MFS family permease/quinol monooxygenase YgiN|uniref:MFS transporter n=1 Tax=uncultured Hydrogenophaga sp. TaxID=199683 RepID=UPI0025833448|nr:MFS transporter [uncultured Hydrogenophaga sp.]
MPRPEEDPSPWAPLRRPVFRMLWLTWLAANVSQSMNDVAAAWMMSSLTTSPLWVALVQTAATLPMFLLGLPSGALADNLDRRRYYLFTQLWVAVVALVLSAMVFIGAMTPGLLLALTCANGVGMAMRWPVFAAVVPELVPRAQLPAALALNGVANNGSRILGPLVAGGLIASAGSAWVFVANAVLALTAAVVVVRWKRVHYPHPLGRERLGTAMRVGLQYVSQSEPIKGVLLRIASFFFHSTALLALLAVVARDHLGGGATAFTVLLAAMGAGAIAAASILPRLRRRYTRDALVLRGVAVQSTAMAVVAMARDPWVSVAAMFVGGMAWITSANTLSVSIQLALPDWVRARGMSIYQMAIMGSSAAGAALWGQVAAWTSVQTSLLAAGASGVTAMLLAQRWMPHQGAPEDLSPQRVVPAPSVAQPPARGRVMLTIEYQVAPERAAAFRTLMLDEGRRSRLRQGALSWELLHDMNEPGRFVELVVDESWADHLRRAERASAADAALRDRRLAFHIAPEPPKVARCLMETST